MPKNKFITAIINSTILLVIGCGASLFYQKYQQKAKRLGKIDRVISPSPCFKAPLKLVMYRNTVVTEEMVLDGTVEKVEAFETRPTDIFLTSFPKSGTTWLQEVVFRLCNQNEDSSEILEDRVPYLEFPYPGIGDISRREGQRLIKSHLPLHLLPKGVWEGQGKVIYIYRNPKDVVVSYFHFAQLLTYLNFQGPFARFVQLFVKDELPYSPYFPHVNEYVQYSRARPEQILCISYEDMKENPEREVRKISKFLKINATDEMIQSICEKTTFEAMKVNPASNYQHWNTFGLAIPNREPFMRKGIVGDHVNYFKDPFTENEMNQFLEMGVKSTGLNFRYSISSCN